MDDVTIEKPEAPAVAALCPHCHEPLTSVGWLINGDVGLVTFYHSAPGCMVGLGCQFVPVQQQRVLLTGQMPSGGLLQ